MTQQSINEIADLLDELDDIEAHEHALRLRRYRLQRELVRRLSNLWLESRLMDFLQEAMDVSGGSSRSSRRVDEKLIKTFVTRPITSSSRELGETCSICQDKYREGEVIMVLPCGHFFHDKNSASDQKEEKKDEKKDEKEKKHTEEIYSCIRPWLKDNDSCPLCRKKVSDTPTATHATTATAPTTPATPTTTTAAAVVTSATGQEAKTPNLAPAKRASVNTSQLAGYFNRRTSPTLSASSPTLTPTPTAATLTPSTMSSTATTVTLTQSTMSSIATTATTPTTPTTTATLTPTTPTISLLSSDFRNSQLFGFYQR